MIAVYLVSMAVALAPLFYFVGLGLHFWLQISGIVRSSKRPDIRTFNDYVAYYPALVSVRVFGSGMLFLLIYYGGDSFGLSLPASTNMMVKAGLCGMAGLGVDRLFVELQSKFGFLKGAIPDLPSGEDHTPDPPAAA